MDKRPFAKFRDGSITLSFWKNIRSDGGEFLSGKVSKTYKDKKDDKWKYTDSFSLSDLLKVSFLIQTAYRRFNVKIEMEEEERATETPSYLLSSGGMPKNICVATANGPDPRECDWRPSEDGSRYCPQCGMVLSSDPSPPPF